MFFQLILFSISFNACAVFEPNSVKSGSPTIVRAVVKTPSRNHIAFLIACSVLAGTSLYKHFRHTKALQYWSSSGSLNA